MRMKIAALGDVHLGCADYTDRRVSDFSKKFVEAIALALSHDAEVILLLGDVFDSSAYRRSIDSFASVLHEIAPVLVRLKSKGVPIVAISGNHEYGRGREGGELRILADLGFVNLLNDQAIELKGVRFCGIPWKSDATQFNAALSRLGSDLANSFLLMHQFLKGSKTIPEGIAQVDFHDLRAWKHVFVGHHHIYETLANISIPGSIEVSNVLEIARGKQKGFVMYDTERNTGEFIPLKPSRPVKYTELTVGGLSSAKAQAALNGWIAESAEPQALLVVKLSGKLSSGRSSEIDLRSCRSKGIQNGCLDVYVINAIDDPVRGASEIRSTIKIDEFMQGWFKKEGPKAVLYFDKFRDEGDDFAVEIRDKIVEGLS